MLIIVIFFSTKLKLILDLTLLLRCYIVFKDKLFVLKMYSTIPVVKFN